MTGMSTPTGGFGGAGAGGGSARPCPSRGEWRARLAHRFDAERTEPESWREDLAHLDRCEVCRETTRELDPTLLFRSLASEGGRNPVASLDASAEAASMVQAVTALRRAERVEGLEGRRDTGGRWSDVARAPWGRWAAAALVALTTLSLGTVTWTDDPETASVLSRTGVVSETDGPRDDGVGSYGEIAGIITTGTELPAGSLGPDRLVPLGSVVEDTLDTLPLIEPFETDPYGTDIYGAGSGDDPVIWQTETTALIWMVDSGDHEGDLQGV